MDEQVDKYMALTVLDRDSLQPFHVCAPGQTNGLQWTQKDSQPPPPFSFDELQGSLIQFDKNCSFN